MKLIEELKRQADALLPEMTACRQDLHRYAETGWLEIRTSSIIARKLTQLGYEVLTGKDVCLAEARMGVPAGDILEKNYLRALEQGAIQPYAQQAKDGFTGVIGILRCGEGPVIAMRFDIDALGVFEDTSDAHRPAREGFSSVNTGMMHACGHDGHTSIGLGVAQVLMNLRHQLRGTVKLIFQPAEEGVRGARAVVAHGHLDDADYLIANHLGGGRGSFPYRIGLTTGSTLATSKLDITFHGKAAHAGAAPETGDNAMLAAATAVLNLHAIPRCSTGDTRINVGTLHAGSGRNVICDNAVLEVEVRGSSTETNRYVEEYARRIAEAAAQMHGCTCRIDLVGAAESLRSSPEMIALCQEVCKKLDISVAPPSARAGASEDCSYMMNRVLSHGGKGVFFNTLTSCAGPAHSRIFDVDESAFPTAVKVFCGMAFQLMGILGDPAES